MPPETPVEPGTRVPRVDPPATRDQVDAYRFGLRRWETALVRGDPVPMHEHVRSQRRAVAAGAVLGVLGVVAALLVGWFDPRPEWRKEDLVVGAPSGALYAVAHGPDRLVPVANAVAGRLVLGALRPSPPEVKAPVPVADDVLAAAPRTAAAAVAGAVAADPGRSIPARWAVCDEVSAGRGLTGTTVLGGAAPEPAPSPGGVLLAVPGGDTWLLTGGRRHRVDTGDAAVRSALGLAGRRPRPASAGLVSALPEGPRLATPVVPDRGEPGPRGVPGRVGDVVVSRPAGGPPRRHVVLANGLQEVTPLVADVLAAASGRPVGEIGPEVVAAAEPVGPLAVDGWPELAPRLLEPDEAPVTCWTWSGVPGSNPDGGVHVGRMPTAAGPVALARADGAGPALDAVAVGAGGAVRASAPGVPGALWVVSAGGVVHGVPDDASAAALGIAAAEPAPEAALRLLPVGAPLDVAAANQLVDVVGIG